MIYVVPLILCRELRIYRTLRCLASRSRQQLLGDLPSCNMRSPNGPFYPTTLLAEYEKVSKVVTSVYDKVQFFSKSYLSKSTSITFEVCEEYYKKTCDILGVENASIEDYKQFDEILGSNRLKPNVKNHNDYQTLIFLSKRAREFDSLLKSCSVKLEFYFQQHASKYFLTFIGKTHNCPVELITQLEEKYRKYNNDIRSNIDSINDYINSFNTLKSPFVKYIKIGPEVETLMHTGCALLLAICDMFTSWISLEQNYPTLLFEEMQKNRCITKKLSSKMKKIEQKRYKHEAILRKSLNERMLIDAVYDEYRKRKQRLAASNLTVKSLIEKTENDIEVASKEVAKSDCSSPHHPDRDRSPTPTAHNLSRLNERLRFLKRQRRRTKNLYKDVSDRTYEQKMDVHWNDQLQSDALAQIEIQKREVKNIQMQVDDIKRQSDVLREIRDLKLSSDVLRWIHQGSLHDKPESVIDAACLYISNYIGRDWPKLYATLPFHPARDAYKRHKDIDTITFVAARHDQTLSQQALISLQKWRSFSRSGQVHNLVRSLRLIEKTDLAKQVERRYVPMT